MTSKLLLFDIDGTLLRTNGAGQRAMAAAARKVLGDGCILREVDMSGKLDPEIYRELADLHPEYELLAVEAAFRAAYLEALETEMPRITSLPGVHACLERLRQLPHVTLGLLTGNRSEAVPLKLKAAGLEPSWFPVTAFGDEAPSRPDLVALAMRKYQALKSERLEPRQVVVIGDTPRDVACAQAHGCVAFAVATGRWSSADLLAARADVVVENLVATDALMNLL